MKLHLLGSVLSYALVLTTPARAEDVSVTFPRLRWGVSAVGGPYVVAPTSDSGGLGGVSGRIGVQLTPYFAMYAQATTLVGGGVTIFSNDLSATISTAVIATAMFAPAAEVDVGFLYVALAPELVFAASAGTISASGTFFGVEGRVGLWASSNAPRARRRGVSLGLDLHATFLPTTVMLVPLLSLGIDME